MRSALSRWLSSFVLLVLLLASPIVFANPSESVLFETTWGGTNDEVALGAASDGSGNVYVTGWTDSFDSVGLDVFLVKFNSHGLLQWQKLWGGNANDVGEGVALDSLGNAYVVGYTESYGNGSADVLLLKFSPSGVLLWQRVWGGPDADLGEAIVIHSSDNIYVTGRTLNAGAGGQDVIILQFDTSGNVLAEYVWGGGGTDIGRGLAFDSSDYLYVTGFTTSFGGNLNNLFLLRLDPPGFLVWQRTLSGIDSDQGHAVAVNGANEIFVVGGTASEGLGFFDTLLLKFNITGSLQWQKLWGDFNNDEGFAATVVGSDLIAAGRSSSFGAGGDDAFFLRLNPAGTLLYDKMWGAVGQDWGTGVTSDPSGRFYVAGHISQASPHSLSIGGSTLTDSTLSVGTTGNNTFAISLPSATLGISAREPMGSTNYAGLRDIFLIRYGEPIIETVPCGNPSGGYMCEVQSNSTIYQFTSNATNIQFIAAGPTGTTGFANVTIPRGAVPDINDLKVFVNGTQLPSQSITITSNSTHYAAYFTFVFSSDAIIDISLGVVTIPIQPIAIALAAALAIPLILAGKRRARVGRWF